MNSEWSAAAKFQFSIFNFHLTLSVVIVNYNVKHFIDQCLHSVYAASDELRDSLGMDTEIWVVDNNSTDGSVQMLREKHPSIHLVVNSDNPGFAKANNQAIRECKGDYILLLNPDTLVQEDTFKTCIDHFRHHSDCGGLSVKMIDGDGHYLKESKRGFPSPATSFFKISGLIKLLPHNRKVAAYYMGHLDDSRVNEVDVLPGAFLMLSRQALDKVGLLDESYFMYGEDIDFSWRIRLAGFKNYYLPTTRILHYKGESTRKSSMNYVYTFYNAMAIFARKYFGRGGAKAYTILIQLAIWLRASLDYGKRMLSHLALPLADFAFAFGGFVAIKHLWATYWAENVNYYSPLYTWVIIPLYVLILLLTSWLAGGYDKPMRNGRIIQGMSIGAVCLLVFYSLLGEELRFSRAIILLGSLWSIVATMGIRWLLRLSGVDGYSTQFSRRRRYSFIGSNEEADRLVSLFDSLGIDPGEIKRYGIGDSTPLSQKMDTDEIIFSGRDVAVKDILDITIFQSHSVNNFRIMPEHDDVLIGSNYTNSPEDLYTPDFGSISTSTNRRTKRIFDIISSLLLLLFSPVLFWFQKRKRHFFADCVNVLWGHRSWVGYSNCKPMALDNENPLPNIRKGIFKTRDRMPKVKNPDLRLLDENYATNYHLSTDVSILFINLNRI